LEVVISSQNLLVVDASTRMQCVKITLTLVLSKKRAKGREESNSLKHKLQE